MLLYQNFLCANSALETFIVLQCIINSAVLLLEINLQTLYLSVKTVWNLAHWLTVCEEKRFYSESDGCLVIKRSAIDAVEVAI